MFDKLGALPRRLRWALHRWSARADKQFHDALFKTQRFDPFTYAYPGYITIRRFAELTEPHLRGMQRAYDLGCGPGEITCELARRNPQITFLGVDHSESAIERALEHKRALSLANVDFRVADVSSFTPAAEGVVLMFDSFHHLLDPRGFVRRLAPAVPRFVLIEPAGDWLGGWQQTLDFDWIADAVDNIRARLGWHVNRAAAGCGRVRQGAAGCEAAPGCEGAGGEGAPVEHRYTLSDLRGFFAGYGLDVRGTIAGLGEYPVDPYAPLPLREDFGKIAADTLAAIEDALVRHNLDLHAKHWVIRAERGAVHNIRVPAPIDPQPGTPANMKGPYDISYGIYDGPLEIAAGTTMHAKLSIKNEGWRSWSSDDAQAPVFVSYHWLNPVGEFAVHDGRRTPLPQALEPGQSVTITATIDAPAAPGHYVLAFDLVEEGVTWFSRSGAPMLKVPMNVR